MVKIYLWGMGKDYDDLLNQILFEKHKNNIYVLGVVCQEKDIYCNKKDGFEVITKDKIFDKQFDYIVVTSSKYYSIIEQEALVMGIDRAKLIDGRVLKLPYFDFSKYITLKENPATILCDDCWGGYVYNKLGLQFSSPLINTYWDRDEYAKFIKAPIYYLQQELQPVRFGDLEKGICPVGRLGEGDESVTIQFIHNNTFDEAKKQWDRRKQRINKDNILIKMGFSSNISIEKKNIYLEAFDSVCDKKILFYFGEEEINGCVKSKRFIVSQKTASRVSLFDYNGYMRQEYCWDVDIFTLLTTGENYLRI